MQHGEVTVRPSHQRHVNERVETLFSRRTFAAQKDCAMRFGYHLHAGELRGVLSREE